MPMPLASIPLNDRIHLAEQEAARRCGQSDILYERLLQEAFSKILDQTPAPERSETEEVLRTHGYDPEADEFQPEDGECPVTGIDADCCPCGRH